MENSLVKFRRGSSANFPNQIEDGYLSVDIETGTMYADVVDGTVAKRIALSAPMFGHCETPSSDYRKTVFVDGIDRYFDGISLRVSFDNIGTDTENPISIGVVSFGSALDYRPVVSQNGTPVTSGDLDTGTPYTFVYLNDSFVLVSGGRTGGPRWMPI